MLNFCAVVSRRKIQLLHFSSCCKPRVKKCFYSLPVQLPNGCSSAEKKEEVISYIRETDIPGKTGQCAPSLSKAEQQQGAPDSSSAVVYQFGMGKTIVAVIMEKAKLFDLLLLTQWFSIQLDCATSELHPCVRNSCSLSGEW